MTSWQDEAISINAVKYGENDVVFEVFTKYHGRMNAYVYGGSSSRKRYLVEPLQLLRLEFLAKTENSMGYFERIEPIINVQSFIDERINLLAISSMCSLLHEFLPVSLAYENLFDASALLIEAAKEGLYIVPLYLKWEVGLLANCGFGLDFSQCALTHTKENLAWVSPKTGRAASYEAGLPFKDKLFRLPPFLLSSNNSPTNDDLKDGLKITSWFIERELIYNNYKKMPQARIRFINYINKILS